MRRCGAARRNAAAPLLLLLLAWHARPANGGGNVLAKLWAKAPPRVGRPDPQTLPQTSAGADMPVPGAAGGAAAAFPGAQAPTGAGMGAATDPGAGAGAGGAGAAAAGAGVVATAAAVQGWVPNVRKRGRPPKSQNKHKRAKLKPRESTASTLLSEAARFRQPGARGPQPGATGARWSHELKGYALALYDLRGSLTATVNEVLRKRPGDFGHGRATLPNGKPAAALSVELLRQWVKKRAAAPAAGPWFALSSLAKQPA